MRPPVLLAAAAMLALPALAQAQVPTLQGTRALGIGGALRGAATGDAALTLNPSGISLIRAYVVEGAYQLSRKSESHDIHASITDSTSAFNLGGGVYYTYLSAGPDGGPERSGHEGGLALSVPLGEKVFLGATGKYVRLETTGGAIAGEQRTRGITFDVGLTVRPAAAFSLGLVGYNLRDLEDRRFPFAVGAGAAATLIPELLITVDGVMDFTRGDAARGNLVHVMGGAEYVVQKLVGIRAGGGRRGDGASFIAGGLTLLAEIGALDVGVQQEASGGEETLFGVSARLFVPSP